MRDINKLEKKEARRDGATLVPNSGRGYSKGDAKLKDFLIDYKFNSKSFSLTQDNWEKLRKQAWGENHREPLISVVFTDGPKVDIIDHDMLMELINIYTTWEEMNDEWENNDGSN